MKKIFSITTLVLIFSITACVSQPKLPEPMPTTEAYDGNDDHALVIVKDGGTGFLYNRITDFQEVDLDTSSFKETVFTVSQYSPTLRNSNGKGSGFYVKKIPPGYYTKTVEATFAHDGIVKTCFSKGTTVYRLDAGKINYIDIQYNSPIVPAINSGGQFAPDYENAVMTKDVNLKNLKEYLSHYPNFKADFIPAIPVANIKFNGSGNNFLRTIDCPNEKVFEVENRFTP